MNETRENAPNLDNEAEEARETELLDDEEMSDVAGGWADGDVN